VLLDNSVVVVGVNGGNVNGGVTVKAHVPIAFN
jgi:hypothetical protein